MLRVQSDSIARRLTGMNMLVSGAALLLACVTFIAYDLITFRDAMVRNLTIEARIIGSNSVSALTFNDVRSAETTLAALRAAPNILWAGVYGPDGRLFAAYTRDSGAGTPWPPAVAQTDVTHLRWFQDAGITLVRPIAFQNTHAGMVSIRSDLRDVHARVKRYALIAVSVLLVSLVAAWVVSRVARRSISRPIVALAAVAHHVSLEKDFSVRAVAPATGELGVLITAFNEMLAQIQERDRSLQEAHAHMEQRVVERTAQLHAMNQELEAFSYSVSHDLRAPLRSIAGFSQALVDDWSASLDAKGQDYLIRIRAAATRMGELIDDLLQLSRVGRGELRHERVDLSAIAKVVATELERTTPERRGQFMIADGLVADGDARLLRIVLENLMGNAWKFTGTAPRAVVEFGHRLEEGQAAYFVRDNGVGFDPAYADRLFSPFQRLHSDREFPGTGIGLATADRIVRRHGGRIWAESAVGRGATFVWTLVHPPHPQGQAPPVNPQAG